MNMRTFDSFDALEQFLREPLFTVPSRTSFPPYTVRHSKDGNEVRVEVALAGYSRDEVEIELANGKLHIRGTPVAKEVDSNWDVIHQGIASRKFDLTFAVSNYYEGTAAEMGDGILTVTLKRVAGFTKKLEIQPALRTVDIPPLLTDK
jgi:molecular chaperone IbpA